MESKLALRGGDKRGNGVKSLSKAVAQLQAARSADTILGVLDEHEYEKTYRMSHLIQALSRVAKLYVPVSALAELHDLRANDHRLAKHICAIQTKVDRGDCTASQAIEALVAFALLYPEGKLNLQRFPMSLLAVVEKDKRVEALSGFDNTNLVWSCRRLGLKLPKYALQREQMLPFQHIQGEFQDLDINTLLAEIKFQIDEVTLGGKTILERRQTAWHSNSNKSFVYSGKRMDPTSMTPTILKVRDAIERRTGIRYDCALINLYPDAQSGMRFHSDPDQHLYWSTNSAVVSVGDTRLFIMRQVQNHGNRHQFYVQSGDLVIMHSDCQERFQHSIRTEQPDATASSNPKVPPLRSSPGTMRGPRISIVFKQGLDEWESSGRRCHSSTSIKSREMT